ncbi:lysozyme [Paracidovorax citrulli]|uniref:glycoside hydrolase family protein n=1 Tax=Paracidovorax citrulli TaxID=80869 RepID=UPI0006622799|nr:lysozyme [Paracidovorax citrulli]UMT96925.1 lysozyme [Paracidovorax citrulli]
MHSCFSRRPFGRISGRQLAAVLSLSGAGLVGIVTHESYTEKAIVPTQGDRPTVGFGSTFHEDGSPVKPGDTTTPVRALIKAQAHISREEQAFRASLPDVALYQAEYDLYMDWVYQYGSAAWRSSGMRRELLAGNYVQACDELLAYRKLTSARKEGPGWVVIKQDAQGRPVRWEFDCSAPANKVCRGVWTRQLERHKKCIEAQQ